MIAIELPPDVETRLRSLAEKTGRTETDLANEAILQLLEDEDDAATASERLKNPTRRWSLEDLEQKRDMEG